MIQQALQAEFYREEFPQAEGRMQDAAPTRYQVLSGRIVEGLIQEQVLLRLRVRPYDAEEAPVPNSEQVFDLVLEFPLAERLAEVLAFLSGMTSSPPDFEVQGEHEF